MNCRDDPGVDVDVGVGAEGAGDDVALRMAGGFGGGDLARSFEFSDEAVIDRDLAEVAVGVDVESAVADVGSTEVECAVKFFRWQHAHGDHGGAHAAEGRVGGAFLSDEGVCVDDGVL